MATLTGVLGRPTSTTGIWSWVTTVDHKRIGTLYLTTALVFFLVGGIEATIMRLQLARPNSDLVSAELFSQLFTMHALTMIFLAIMPLSVAFFNWVVPLQIGARDVAFPRLNALSYWIYLFGGLLLNAGWLTLQAPGDGWFAYANLTSERFSPGQGMDFYVLGLIVLGTSSMAGAFNFVVTIINLRAPGMTLMRMPVFTWMAFVTSVLLILAMPVITVGLIELGFDRFFGTNFFNVYNGADVLLWQHLFWVFGHPEVYILILPAMGIVSEVLPTFARKPLFGYPVVVYSGVVIGFLGWSVWSHHMFATGLGPVADAVFASTTMTIAIPTGVKVFNWLATLWGGDLEFKTPLYFAVGFIALFIIGGLSGMTHAATPSDLQQTDTYYIVAHIHYVLFGGSIMGIFAGIYYWFPKMTGRLLHEGLGKLHFWLFFVGMNMTFGPMHYLGLVGMPRRNYTYPSGMGWDLWNLVASIGVFVIIAGALVFIYNVVRTTRRGEVASNDPWDGRTLEWSIASPPPHYNFAEIPTVHSRDAFWKEKYPGGGHVPHRVPAGAAGHEGYGTRHENANAAHAIQMPGPSYYPIVTALGLALLMASLVFHPFSGLVGPLFGSVDPFMAGLGLLLMVWGIFGWAFEPAE
ncbi:MAG: cytochrome c oxidase subunit I [Chloroflexi bacterium]|nr:cytochrome c oxidase subunit I [Chloroflexota bacterium]